VKRSVVLGVLLAAIAGAACRRPAESPDTLVVLADRDVQGLDPHTAGQVLETQSALANVYEGLVSFDHRMAMRPALAEGWTNPDERTWDFTIREGVKLHDRETLTEEDVIFSLERARSHPKSVLRVALANVTAISWLGPMRVRLTTKEPDSYLIARLRQVFVVSKRFVTTQGEAALATRSAGTGPYTVTGREEGTVLLSRHETYWGGPAAIARAVFVSGTLDGKSVDRFRTPRSRFALSVRIGTPTPAEYVEETAPGLGVLYLGFDLREGSPFAAPEVREAVTRAIDYGRLRKLAKGGDGVTPTQVVPPFVFGYSRSIGVAPQDGEAAKLLLGKRTFAVDLDLRALNAPFAPVLAESLEAVGIRARPLVHPEAEFFRKLEAGKSALYVLRFFCWTGDAQEILDEVIHSKDPARGLGEFNFSGAVDPVPGLDRMIEDARWELHPELRVEMLKEILARAMAARLVVPLLQERDALYLPPDVEWPLRADTMRLVAEARFRSPSGRR